MNGEEILNQALQTWTEQQPNNISIIETNTEKNISYQQLTNAISNLRIFLGASPLIIVAALPGSIVNSVLWLTALTSGHLLIPVSPQLTNFEYKEVFKRHKPDLLITEKFTIIKEHAIKQLTVSQIETIISPNKKTQSFDKNTKASAGSIYLETSGTTGTPKGMILTATQLVITANAIREQHQLTQQSRGLTPLPFYHVNAPVVSLLSTILAGGSVIIAPKFSARHFWEWVQTFDPTWISIVPTITAILLKFDKPEFLKSSSLQFIRTASAPLPKTILLAFEKKFGIPVIETYGVSEAGSTIFANPLPPDEHKPGSVGLPLGIQVRLVDPQTNKEVSQDEIGEVEIKGKQIISHYEENRGKDSFDNGWFKTGDLGYVDKDGYLFLTSRKKEIIIRGGENIFPREIEEVLLMYPNTVEVAVVGQKDEILGEKVIAFAVSSDNGKTNSKDMKNFVSDKLSPQKVPSEIYLVNQLPRGRTGKIDKNALKEYIPSQ